MAAIAPYPVGIFFPYLIIPSVVLSVEPFILKEHATFISNVVPEIGHNTNTDSHCIPVKLFRVIHQQFLHPFPVPHKITVVLDVWACEN